MASSMAPAKPPPTFPFPKWCGCRRRRKQSSSPIRMSSGRFVARRRHSVLGGKSGALHHPAETARGAQRLQQGCDRAAAQESGETDRPPGDADAVAGRVPPRPLERFGLSIHAARRRYRRTHRMGAEGSRALAQTAADRRCDQRPSAGRAGGECRRRPQRSIPARRADRIDRRGAERRLRAAPGLGHLRRQEPVSGRSGNGGGAPARFARPLRQCMCRAPSEARSRSPLWPVSSDRRFPSSSTTRASCRP